MEIQSEFMDINNVLKEDFNKLWFDLKETNTHSESDCFDFKRFQKENIMTMAISMTYQLKLIIKSLKMSLH